MRLEQHMFGAIVVIASCCVMSESQAGQTKATALVRLSEMRSGTMASEETCAVVYSDGQFRAERVSRRRGDSDWLRVNEGRLDDSSLNELNAILNADAFRELKSPGVTRRLADDNVHALSVLVMRKTAFQELSYPTKESRKGASQTLRPLLEWWQKTIRKSPGKDSSPEQKTRCVPQS
jgi:hypothetical protein